jgi:uncharacterized protein YigA (DUF484 family)
MRTFLTIATAAFLIVSSDVQAADRARSQAQIDSGRVALNDFKAKAGESKIVADDVNAAERNLEKAATAQKAGEKMFGGLTDEAEANVRHEIALLDLNIKLAASKLEQARIGAESAALGKKIEAVQAKLKIFDDFRSEIARLKSKLADSQKGGRELEILKKEKGSLEEQIIDFKKGKELLETLKAENLKLTSQLEKLQSEQKTLQAVPVAVSTPVKVEKIVPEKKMDAVLPKPELKEIVEKPSVNEVPQGALPQPESAVRIEETVETQIVPAVEK